MRLVRAILLASLTPYSFFGQSYTISTFAGGGLPVNIPGPSASLTGVSGVAVDSAGNLFFTVPDSSVVLRLDARTGILTLAAGNGSFGFSGDNGPATNAELSGPSGVAVDSTGNLYIVDAGNNCIRRVSNGVITTVAGNGTLVFGGDNGPATRAGVSPTGVAVDSAGNLYIAEYGNQRVRKVSNGVITTVAGNGTFGFGGDGGPATSAQLNYPYDVAVDSAGNLYIADYGNQRVRKVSNGVITTVAGNGTFGFGGDGGPATNAQLYDPLAVAVDGAGNLYIADWENSRVRKVSNGVITTVAGNGTIGNGGVSFSGDGGQATSAQLSGPFGVAVDAAGNLYIADQRNNRIRKVSGGVITTVAGNGTLGSGDNGLATAAQIDPVGVAADSAGNVYVADSNDGRVRKVFHGEITTVSGGGPFGVAVDSAGNLYMADAENHVVRKVSLTGVVSTVAGSGTAGFSGDNGPAASAQLNYPFGVAVDSAGNLYIADALNYRIRLVSNGVITTLAGNGTQGSSGDNGPAINAQLGFPNGVAIDFAGNLYIADTFNYRVRMVSNGVISTINGGFSSPYPFSKTTSPRLGVAVDSLGNLYIADVQNNCVRKVSNGLITTIAGSGTAGFGGDGGPATGAQLHTPTGVAVDSAGNVYIADQGSLRVRILTPSGPPLPSITAVTNAASNLPGPIAPGEVVVITGSGLGPSSLVAGFIADPVVTFDGVPASLIYAEANQISAIVPDEVAGKTSTVVQVQYQGQALPALTVPVAVAALGLFTLDGSGSGQGAILNQDGSVNNPANAAAKGSTVSLFATGTDGSGQSIMVTIGELPRAISSAKVPGPIGVSQINVQLPNDAPSGGTIPIYIFVVGEGFSQQGVTMAIQ